MRNITRKEATSNMNETCTTTRATATQKIKPSPVAAKNEEEKKILDENERRIPEAGFAHQVEMDDPNARVAALSPQRAVSLPRVRCQNSQRSSCEL
jgi:hypothetical protein